MTDDALAGKWTKESDEPCSSGYPDELELHPSGRYTGHMHPNALEHPRWDVGTYESLEDGQLAISTANDAVGRYAFRLERDRLSLTDETGCTFGYRRIG